MKHGKKCRKDYDPSHVALTGFADRASEAAWIGVIAGQLLKFIPGIGDAAGGVIMAGIAASATFGLGCGYTEFLKTFHADQKRMPNGEKIKTGFRTFWENRATKILPPARTQM
jgi:uncharacterized protein (DUF697 family)